jgi:hypothetical protein
MESLLGSVRTSFAPFLMTRFVSNPLRKQQLSPKIDMGSELPSFQSVTCHTYSLYLSTTHNCKTF